MFVFGTHFLFIFISRYAPEVITCRYYSLYSGINNDYYLHNYQIVTIVFQIFSAEKIAK